jgi:predicted DNA-binding transcriptional regulator AlpA
MHYHLEKFDSLPDSAHVRLPVVMELFACSPATVWRMAKRGTLKPKKLSERVTAFNVGDLRRVLQAGVSVAPPVAGLGVPAVPKAPKVALDAACFGGAPAPVIGGR